MGGFFRSKKFRIILCIIALLIGMMLYAVTQDGLNAKFDAFKPLFIKPKNMTTRLTHKLYSVLPKVCNFFV